MTEKRRFFKAEKVKANVPSLFRGWADWKEGEYVVGKYHSMYETVYKKATQFNWRIEVLDCNFQIRDKDGKKINPVGKILTLNSAGQLNKFMKDVPIGHGVEVVYGGMQADKADPDTEYHTFSKIESGPLEEEEEQGL